jgi:3-oxoacyl-[acyl-carrier protein] reductase
MDLGLKGKVAIVTGAGRGIGRAVALTMAEEGVRLVVNKVTEEGGQALLDEIEQRGGQKAVLIIGDVSEEAVANQIVDTAVKEYGKLDILINNAGISPKLPFWEITPEQFDRVMAVNTRSIFLLSKAAFEPMKRNGRGSIVNLSSVAGLYGTVNSAVHYSASKGGILGMTRTLALQMAPYNINVNAVVPGRTDTAMTQMLSPEKIRETVSLIPLGRLGTTQDIANLVVFIASERASYITANWIEITGGWVQRVTTQK